MGCEAFGAFEEGGAGDKIQEVRDAEGEGADRGAKFASIITHAVVGAIGGARVKGRGAEITGFLLDEELQEQSETLKEGCRLLTLTPVPSPSGRGVAGRPG